MILTFFDGFFDRASFRSKIGRTSFADRPKPLAFFIDGTPRPYRRRRSSRPVGPHVGADN
jgi:hypothetical protein